VTVSQHIYRI